MLSWRCDQVQYRPRSDEFNPVRPASSVAGSSGRNHDHEIVPNFLFPLDLLSMLEKDRISRCVFPSRRTKEMGKKGSKPAACMIRGPVALGAWPPRWAQGGGDHEVAPMRKAGEQGEGASLHWATSLCGSF